MRIKMVNNLECSIFFALHCWSLIYATYIGGEGEVGKIIVLSDVENETYVSIVASESKIL